MGPFPANNPCSDLPFTRHGCRNERRPSQSWKGSGAPGNVGSCNTDVRSSNNYGIDFLFVVNELNLDRDQPREADRWGNYTPPETWHGYDRESIGSVFRYHNGKVTAEETYTWYRPGSGLPGSIGYWDLDSDEAGNAVPVYQAMKAYSTFSVFNCGPFLPCIYSPGDVSQDEGDFEGWRALHFHHHNGISQASPNGGYKYVAGRNVAFMNELLPTAYANSDTNAPRSKGLGGQVGLVIALMALSQSPGRIDAAFNQSKWNSNTWTGRRHHFAWPSPGDEPRGVLVHIALDPQERPDARMEAIHDFEWRGVFVAG